MNQFAGYVQEVPMGYRAMLRFAKDARPNPIMGEGGRPVIFATEAEAWREVTKHLLAYFNGDLRRDGETLLAHRQAAEMLFRPGKKPIPVETRRRA